MLIPHKKLIKEVSKELDIDEEVVKKVINEFFYTLRFNFLSNPLNAVHGILLNNFVSLNISMPAVKREINKILRKQSRATNKERKRLIYLKNLYETQKKIKKEKRKKYNKYK